ncbi:DUF1054 domain-containing protein [Paenibacillus filicis]|uniref:UPF0637 protein O9H85_02625 n=1 Tax=Paenibacillus gyeongsangnamensis TaxID=3388067 RepID=A0ABT4Q3F7_9BACL|nr:DUF1054 domain-containing protein [Paenibacillus filicis]MCZ8511348.1 DUF1054 domain-containing protein [Paenibacillus filicis]
MSFTGFKQADFDIFRIEGLEPRMEAIRGSIQPKFKEIGEALVEEVALLTGTEMFVHIAQHLRRTTNPPKDTWLALAPTKRGYKMSPHFQIGLFDDHVFLWFALIYELPHKQRIAEAYLKHVRKTKKTIPGDYVISFDHTRKNSVAAGSLNEKQWKEALERFRDVKSTELLVGRHILPGDPLLQDGQALLAFAKETFGTLMPLYLTACKAGS